MPRGNLSSLGKADATAISVEDCADNARIFAGMAFNGDGVITPAATISHTRRLATIISTLGGQSRPQRGNGIDRATLDRFFDEGSALCAWRQAPSHRPTACRWASNWPRLCRPERRARQDRRLLHALPPGHLLTRVRPTCSMAVKTTCAPSAANCSTTAPRWAHCRPAAGLRAPGGALPSAKD